MKRKIFIALLVVLTLGFSNPKIFVKANEDRLITYKQKLSEINTILGTTYAFPTEEQLEAIGKEYTDMVEFYYGEVYSES